MELTLQQIAAICDGEVVGISEPQASQNGNNPSNEPGEVVVSGASIDSRETRPGQLFVPLVAERDGHDFITAAIHAGAAATLVERRWFEGRDNSGIDTSGLDVPGVVVSDTARALRSLGQWAARTLKGNDVPIVGITGSVGKTTVKDLAVAAMITKHAHANVRSFNNELGVPLTLLATPTEAEVVVIEMGARGIGHIAELCAIAPPDVGAVTTVGAVHTSEFGSLDGVITAKGELVEALPPDGTAVLNAEVPEVAAMRDRTAATVITFGSGGDVWASDITLDDALCPRFVAHYGDGHAPVALNVAGEHQVSNALAAITIAISCGVALDDAAAGVAQAQLSPWRMEMHKTNTGGLVINDAYNANSLSMKAAIDALAALDVRDRVAVLGTMAELGDRHDTDHRDVADYARSRGIRVVAYDEAAYGADPEDCVASLEEAEAAVGAVDDGAAVLVKASRVAGLERLAERLISR